MEMTLSNNFQTLTTEQISNITAGRGTYSTAILQAGGAIAVGNCIAIGAATAPIWGGVALVGGLYWLYLGTH